MGKREFHFFFSVKLKKTKIFVLEYFLVFFLAVHVYLPLTITKFVQGIEQSTENLNLLNFLSVSVGF
jgi:hypothetical protein